MTRTLVAAALNFIRVMGGCNPILLRIIAERFGLKVSC